MSIIASERDRNMENKLIGSWSLKPDTVDNWAYWEKAFSNEECDEIIKYCKKRKLSDGLVNNPHSMDEKYRHSKILFFGPGEMDWVFRKLTDICLNLNDRFFGFDLWGFGEGLQFTEYNAPGGKYNYHLDRCFDKPVRKLSLVVQLTDPKKYEEGNLELLLSDEPTKINREKGYLVLFPSYILHRVTPIKKGTRHSLVGWITGKPFR